MAPVQRPFLVAVHQVQILREPLSLDEKLKRLVKHSSFRAEGIRNSKQKNFRLGLNQGSFLRVLILSPLKYEGNLTPLRFFGQKKCETMSEISETFFWDP